MLQPQTVFIVALSLLFFVIYLLMRGRKELAVKGVGTDIISVERIREAMAKPHFRERLFTAREIAYCEKFRDPAERFSGRFAAKEAVAKALGCGFGEKLSWHDIEILPNEAGAPTVFFSKGATKRFKHPRVALSLSHSEAYATAFALWV